MGGNRLQHGERRPFVNRVFPRPVRKLFRWMNFHFSENGRAIYSFAKLLPEEQRKEVIEHGKDFTTARTKKNVPRGFRNVLTSLIVGQGLWYFVCPAVSDMPAIRDGNPALAWMAGGGLDKLFLSADDLLHTTGGQSEVASRNIMSHIPMTLPVGAALVALELATDFSRCFIEYWSQKRYGLVADGAARLYGQVRPFPVRYSSFEAYQKAISYIIRPWTIGTPNQIFSSLYGILGSIWRTTIQLGIVVTAGRAIDNFFKKVSGWLGLRGFAERMKENAEKRAKDAMDAVKGIVGDERFLALQYRMAAESRSFWKWNPFKPALSWEDAQRAMGLSILIQRHVAVMDSRVGEMPAETEEVFKMELSNCRVRMEQIFGKRTLRKLPAYNKLDAQDDIRATAELLEVLMAQLRHERELT